MKRPHNYSRVPSENRELLTEFVKRIFGKGMLVVVCKRGDEAEMRVCWPEIHSRVLVPWASSFLADGVAKTRIRTVGGHACISHKQSEIRTFPYGIPIPEIENWEVEKNSEEELVFFNKTLDSSISFHNIGMMGKNKLKIAI